MAFARELAAAAVANIPEDPQRSMLLAMAAVEATRSHGEAELPEAVEALHRAVTASRAILSVPGVGGAVDWSPDGTVFVTEGPEESGIVDIRDAASGESVMAFQGHDDDLNDVAFSEDGSMLATTGDDGALRVWATATGKELLETQSPAGPAVQDVPVRSPSFSADGTLVEAAWPDAVRVIDVGSGRTVIRIRLRTRSAPRSAPTGRGSPLVVDGVTATVVGRGHRKEALQSRPADGDEPLDIAWSPDGRSFATAQPDGTARVWDGSTGDAVVSDSRAHRAGLGARLESRRLAPGDGR